MKNLKYVHKDIAFSFINYKDEKLDSGFFILKMIILNLLESKNYLMIYQLY